MATYSLSFKGYATWGYFNSFPSKPNPNFNPIIKYPNGVPPNCNLGLDGLVTGLPQISRGAVLHRYIKSFEEQVKKIGPGWLIVECFCHVTPTFAGIQFGEPCGLKIRGPYKTEGEALDILKPPPKDGPPVISEAPPWAFVTSPPGSYLQTEVRLVGEDHICPFIYSEAFAEGL